MTEILAPAGNAECALAAIKSGADAIYLGYSNFSARSAAENFDDTALKEIVKKAHFSGVKVYVAMNTLVKNSELKEFLDSLIRVWNIGADAIILQDIFLGKYISENIPKVVLHLSTQAGICDENGAILAKICGFSRVILARETPIEEIEKITKVMETEVFIQGALCTAFSGQCYFSSFAGGNSGNRGKCKQPCRKKYFYNRNGETQYSYALSLSDLCVGENIEKLRAVGVSSFKIEGRMRRAEYVAAAVSYYRGILDGTTETENKSALSDLKRTFNRGNYTGGLAFGQDKRLLSRSVQGHIGENVGVVKVVNGKYTVESLALVGEGDGFKILRKGEEIGGAVFGGKEKRGFSLVSRTRLQNGDSVFITTDVKVNERVLKKEKRQTVPLSLYFCEGEKAEIRSGKVVVYSDESMQTAQNQPLKEEDVKNCFLKIDGLPAEIKFEKIEIKGKIFIPKSTLNNLRRKFFEAYAERNTIRSEKIEFSPELLTSKIKSESRNNKTAVILNSLEEENSLNADIIIYKPSDYRAEIPEALKNLKTEKYLYYPAYSKTADEGRISELLKEDFDGIFAENYGGIEFAKKQNIKVFAGVGWNISNKIAVEKLREYPEISYYTLSKEIDEKEQELLSNERSFALSSGGIKLMDLCYCPFGKTCGNCDRKEVYTLTDEDRREFPVRRYISGSGECRFEVYNCAYLIGGQRNGNLYDFSSLPQGITKSKAYAAAKKGVEEEKKLYKKYTSGHARNSVL